MPIPRTLESVKRANKVFFSKKSVEFHGDKSYKIVGDVLEVICKTQNRQHTVRYSIGKNNLLTFLSN